MIVFLLDELEVCIKNIENEIQKEKFHPIRQNYFPNTIFLNSSLYPFSLFAFLRSS